MSRYFAEHPASALIGSTVREITELFNDVRFGKQELAADLRAQVDISIKELEQGAKAPSRSTVAPPPNSLKSKLASLAAKKKQAPAPTKA